MLVGFVVAGGPLSNNRLNNMHQCVEHVQWIAIAVDTLLGRLTIDRQNVFAIFSNVILKPEIEGCLKLFDTAFGQRTTDGRRARMLLAIEAEWFSQCIPMNR